MIGRWLPLAVFSLLGLLLAVGVFMNAGKNGTEIQSPLIGRPAPAFALPRFDQPTQVVTPSTLAGRPYLLNVWASWCAACRIEHPEIARIAASGRVMVVGYNYKDANADAQRWLAQFGNPFHLNLVDAAGDAALDWGIYGAPETFLVDARGVVRWKHIGPVTPEVTRDELWPLLDDLGAPSGAVP